MNKTVNKTLISAIIVTSLIISARASAQESRPPYLYVDFDAITLDDVTAQRGYTITMFDEQIKFGITPNVLTQGGAFEFKEINPVNGSLSPYPNEWTPASKILEFDIKNKEYYDDSKPFWIQIKVTSGQPYDKGLFYFDQGKMEWIQIPSEMNYETGYMRAAFHLPFAKLAVFENSGIMSVGMASWYTYKECYCAASPDYPKGTELFVTNTDNDKSIVVTINDWGPERDIFPDRVIDLDVTAFKQIGNYRLGIIPVSVVPYVSEIHDPILVAKASPLPSASSDTESSPSLNGVSSEAGGDIKSVIE